MYRNRRNAIVLVIDRLGAGHLGPYGNTWLDTPHFNRLAAESFLLEYAISDSPQLSQVYRSYWQGLHAMCQGRNSSNELMAQLGQNGIATALLTDDADIRGLKVAESFDESFWVEQSQGVQAAGDIEETQLARLFAEILTRQQSFDEPYLLWVHSRGMYGSWDAPSEFRRRLADEEDPVPPDFVEPPSHRLAADFDPDDLLGITQAYAGQIALLDICLGVLLDSLSGETDLGETLLIVTSPRGYPLGEHARVGSVDNALYSELLHVPLFVRLPDTSQMASRTHALVQPADLNETLQDWFGVRANGEQPFGKSLLPLVRGEQDSLRNHAVSTAGSQKSLRTPAWFLRQANGSTELFVKPDDRWEVNEISDRCEDVTNELGRTMDEIAHTLQNDQSIDFPPLSDTLLYGLD